MFKNILIPADLTDKAAKGLELALKLCTDPGGRITLLHVIELIDDSEEEEFEPFYEKLKRRAFKKMNDTVAQLASGREKIHVEILCGGRVREIVKFAQENGADLIVLSSHRIDDIHPAQGWATISYKVAILAPCPVLMVK